MTEKTEVDWVDVGAAEELQCAPLQQVLVNGARVALTFRDGVFGAISGVCNHAGGPLSQGALSEDYVVCPWHQWKFHRIGGQGEQIGSSIGFGSQTQQDVGHEGPPDRPPGVLGRLRRRMTWVPGAR